MKKVAQSKKKVTKKFLSPLKPNDLIDIVAPGSPADSNLLKAAAKVLKSWGYRVRYSKDLLKPGLMYLAQTDEYRFQDLKKALLAKDSKAVWCLRGGYGAIRLLPQLQKVKKPQHKKLFIGLSDMTSIHLFLNQKWNWPSLHAPLVDRVAKQILSEKNIQEVQASLNGSETEFTFKNLVPLNEACWKSKKIEGRIIGGNLMVATSTVGTPWQLQGQGNILFFEELNERAYRIDRCLQQMKQAGVFKKVKAVIFGDMLNCLESDGKDYVTPTLKEFFNELNIPAFMGVESGHAEVQRPVFFNTKAKITISAIDQSEMKVVIYSPYEILKPRK